MLFIFICVDVVDVVVVAVVDFVVVVVVVVVVRLLSVSGENRTEPHAGRQFW